LICDKQRDSFCRFLEELIENARHIEVQCVGDGTGRVIAIGERECSLQRRNQKIIEIAPSPSLSPAMRAELQGKQASSFKPSLLLSGAATSILQPLLLQVASNLLTHLGSCCNSPHVC